MSAHEDGRGFYAALTYDGEALLGQMWPVYARVLRETFVDAVSRGDAISIARGLGRAARAARSA